MAKLEPLDSKYYKIRNLANCYRHADKALDRLNEAFNIMQPNIHANYPMKKRMPLLCSRRWNLVNFMY